MTDPWVEVKQHQDPEIPAGPGYSEHIWQGMFVCHVEILPYTEWFKLRWGFNAAVLFDESLERQRLFLESQYGIWREAGLESADARSLAFRFINRPGDGLLVAVIGKIHTLTETAARESTRSYYNEVKSTFPYDYRLVPARTKDEFRQMTGMDILDEKQSQAGLAQIGRLEIPKYPVRNSPFLQGIWRSNPHAHEQIWRSLAASPSPLLLNVTLRSTVLYEKERQKLLESDKETPEAPSKPASTKTLSALEHWQRNYIERRLAPWKKFFYLQIHLASTDRLSEHLFRTIGASLTLGKDSESLPGYRVSTPQPAEAQTWCNKLRNLDILMSGSFLSTPRLSEIADLEEVFSVMRLPYPAPDNGLPQVSYKSSGNALGNTSLD